MARMIYLCGGINGLTDAQCNDWRTKAKQLLPEYIHVDPMRRDYRGREDECVAEIVNGDLRDINDSDIILANAETPSWGTGMEIFYARRVGKHIVTVCPGERVSPWLRYHSSVVVKSLEEAADYIRSGK